MHRRRLNDGEVAVQDGLARSSYRPVNIGAIGEVIRQCVHRDCGRDEKRACNYRLCLQAKDMC